MIIRTTENVSDFSDLRISYLKNLTQTTQQRQETLFEKTDAISSPPKEMLNDVTIDSLPLDSLTESG